MKISGLVALTALVVGGCALAVDLGERQLPASPPSPHLALSARVHDFGSLIPGERVREVFSLRNVGTQPLELRLVRTSRPWGLTAHVSDARIAPGGEEELRIDFSSKVWERGTIDEQVVIYSNDPDESVVKLEVYGDLFAPVGWSPRLLEFAIRRDEISFLPEISVISQDGRPIGPLRVTSFVPYLVAEAETAGSGAYVVTLDLDPKVPLGYLLGYIRIETRHPVLPVLEVPVRGRVVGDLLTEPHRLDFGIVEGGQPATAQIKLVKFGSRDVQVVKVEPHLPTAAEVSLSKHDGDYQIAIRLPAPPTLQSLEGHLNVFTDHPVEPVVQVPVVGWTSARRPFDLVAAGGGAEARLFGLIQDALNREESVSAEHFLTKILGGIRDERAVSLLLRALESKNWHIRSRAIEVLGLLQNRGALEPIRKAVTDDVDEEVRRAAALALVRIAGREALPELLLALQDNDDWVREDAADLLGSLGDRRAIPALKNALSDDEEEDVREAAAKALKIMSGKGLSQE